MTVEENKKKEAVSTTLHILCAGVLENLCR